MNGETLQQAINCLKIRNVWQHSASARLDDSLLEALAFPERFRLEYRHVLAQTLFGALQGQEHAQYIFRVKVDLGVRYLQSASRKKTKKKRAAKKKSVSADSDVLAVIEASYIAEYDCEENPGEEALDTFAVNNASFHIWPFWREYTASQANRMNLPKPTLPLIRARPFLSSETGSPETSE